MSMVVKRNNGKLFSSPLLEINTHFIFFHLRNETFFEDYLQSNSSNRSTDFRQIGDKFGQTFGFDFDFWENNRNTTCNTLPDV